MSITRETSVFCDICADWVRFTGTAKTARRLAALHGWGRRKGKDICKLCLQKSKEESDNGPTD